MAVYTFKCSTCNKTSEVSMLISEYITDIKETKTTKCPLCGEIAHLQMGNPAFHLKGDGWYITDYKNTKKSPKKVDK